MTFIDWSDSEEMIGLLCEFVADARGESQCDRGRQCFLSELSDALGELNDGSSGISLHEATARLREIRDATDPEFAADPVMGHVSDCIEELERIARETITRSTRLQSA
jgi:hypothetical protein